MFGRIWNFVKRHKKKFIFTGVVVGGFTILWKYAKKKIQDFQELEAEECLAHAKRQHHFDSNQRTCNMTVLSMLPSLRETVMKLLDSEALTAQLKNKPENRIEIWEELKIMSFARTIVSVYSICIIVVFLRVQLNILGGYIYLDTLSSTDKSGAASSSPDPSIVPSDLQQRYLGLVQYVLEEGLAAIARVTYDAVSTHLKPLSLKSQLSLTDVQEILREVRQTVERGQDPGVTGSRGSGLIQHLLPSDADQAQACGMTPLDLMYYQLQTETRDMLDSSDFSLVFHVCLDTGFTRTIDRLAESFKPAPSEPLVNINQLSMPLAKIIPLMNSQVHTILGDPPNALVQELLLKEQMKDFAANVYEAFSQPPTVAP